jgi:hypothetical protein
MMYPTRGVYAILESQILSSLRNRRNTNEAVSETLRYGHLAPAVHVETLILGEDLASIEFFTFWKLLPASLHD